MRLRREHTHTHTQSLFDRADVQSSTEQQAEMKTSHSRGPYGSELATYHNMTSNCKTIMTNHKVSTLSPSQCDRRTTARKVKKKKDKRKEKLASHIAREDHNNIVNAASNLLDQMTHRSCRWKRRSGWRRQTEKGEKAVGGRLSGGIYTTCFSKGEVHVS